MASRNRRSFRIVVTLLLLLVVVGLLGHFSLDVSGRDPLAASGLHTGLILLPLITVVGVLTLVTTLFADDPIRRWRWLPPHVQPPIALH